jgi:phosphatidylinositol alpha-1,6-mannosyltransferase
MTILTSTETSSSHNNSPLTKPFRILIVSQAYWPFMGGVETHVNQISHEYQARGHHVDIAAMNFAAPDKRPSFHILHGDLLAPTSPSFEDQGIKVHSLSPENNKERIGLLPIAVRVTPKLRRIAYHELSRLAFPAYRRVIGPKLLRLAEQADVVHSMNFSYLGWTAQWAAKLAGKPFVCTPHVHPKQWGDGPDDIEYYKRCDGIIALTDTDKEYLIKIGVPEKLIQVTGVSPNLPSEVHGEEFRRRHGINPETPIVLFVGRMTSHKGAPSVIDAAQFVWKSAPETLFLFIGPKSDGEVNWFNENTDPRIRYLGRVDAQEKGDALDACTIFCMPSESEILPNVYLEAWSRKKPVVGGTAPGLEQIVEGNGGGTCVAQNPQKIADILIHLLADKNLQRIQGEAGYKTVEQKYSVSSIAEQLLFQYRKVIENAK